MKSPIHTVIGHGGTLTPFPLDVHQTADEFIEALAKHFQVEPNRIVRDEWRTVAYEWTNVTVSLPDIGSAAFSVDHRRTGRDAVCLYLDNRPVPFGWAPGSSLGQTLAQAVSAFHARHLQEDAQG
ncbi:hypothetical protein [Streptomyces rubradiris]|uniref:hypothetical protein n=1 Tax=Streptomyces rubradiris TaxID=285531 RepID=UPI00167BF244|nr:hypothetical protein [Streptomyces rubradiris]GHH31593.1 hypothetical protein GCM10018792_79430 [Streptomyces rubradiris]